MAWVIGNPADDGKLRLGPDEIRKNWYAIQNADLDAATFLQYRSLQMANRTTVGVAVDPVAVTDTFYVYTKDDDVAPAGKQEMFLCDGVATTPNIIQLTNDGKIGSTATDFEVDNISFDGTVSYNEHNMIRAWGLITFDPAGPPFLIWTIRNGFPVTAPTYAAGDYTIDITGMGPGGIDFTNVNEYGVFVLPVRSTLNYDVALGTKGLTSFHLRSTQGSTTTNANPSVYVMLVS